MPKINDRATREARRDNAIASQAKYNALTPQQRIARLDSRLGKGVGAQKERLMLGILVAATEAID